MNVDVDLNKLRASRLGFTDIQRAIGVENLTVSGGSVDVGGAEAGRARGRPVRPGLRHRRHPGEKPERRRRAPRRHRHRAKTASRTAKATPASTASPPSP
ncbi:MAG: hypothetical protein WKG07_19290 [Hymenobacter sp.]